MSCIKTRNHYQSINKTINQSLNHSTNQSTISNQSAPENQPITVNQSAPVTHLFCLHSVTPGAFKHVAQTGYEGVLLHPSDGDLPVPQFHSLLPHLLHQHPFRLEAGKKNRNCILPQTILSSVRITYTITTGCNVWFFFMEQFGVDNVDLMRWFKWSSNFICIIRLTLTSK